MLHGRVSGLVISIVAVVATSVSGVAFAPPGLASGTPVVPPLAAWGHNNQGQLGDGTTTSSTASVSVVTNAATSALFGKAIAQVSVGMSSACAVTTDGLLACWGSNAAWQLGVMEPDKTTVPIAVIGGSLAGRKVAQVSVGARHACALATDNTLHCWGYGPSGELGQPWLQANPVQKIPGQVYTNGAMKGLTITQVSAGTETTCAVASGRAFCWGNNDFGQVGIGTLGRNYDEPVAVHRGTAEVPGVLYGTVSRVVTGWGHACALKSDGALACWGANHFGQLGNPTTTTCRYGYACSPVPLKVGGPDGGTGILAGRAVATVSVGSESTCASVPIGGVACWGRNTWGQLGDGTTTDRAVPTRVAYAAPSALSGRAVVNVTSGEQQTCALTSDQSIACWGLNDEGLLGVATSGTCAGKPCSTVPVLLTGVPGSGVMAGAKALAVDLGDTSGAAMLVATPVTPPPSAVPGAPTGVTATAGIGEATVRWTAPSSPSPILHYIVERSTDAGVTWTVAEGSPVPAAVTSLLVRQLHTGVPVTFRVLAVNEKGPGPYSAPSPAVSPLPPAGPPGPPSGLLATAGDRSVRLQWSPPATDGGAPVTSYVLQATTDRGTTWGPVVGGSFPATAAAGVNVPAVNGVPVRYRVAAVNLAGRGEFSSPSAMVIPHGVLRAPGPVRGLTAVASAHGRIVFRWLPPRTGGAPSTFQYQLRRGPARWSPWTTTSGRAVTLRGVAAGWRVSIAVRAVNPAGVGPTTTASAVAKR